MYTISFLFPSPFRKQNGPPQLLHRSKVMILEYDPALPNDYEACKYEIRRKRDMDRAERLEEFYNSQNPPRETRELLDSIPVHSTCIQGKFLITRKSFILAHSTESLKFFLLLPLFLLAHVPHISTLAFESETADDAYRRRMELSNPSQYVAPPVPLEAPTLPTDLDYDDVDGIDLSLLQKPKTQ